LFKKNLIIRQPCPQDKRAADITLTEPGLELLREVDKKQNQMDHLLQLTDEEANLLSEMLDKSRG
jgi:DNA-binding MarR family transcriptional regulator